MRNHIVLVFILNSFFVSSQTNGYVEYDVSKNFAWDFHTVKTLSFNETQSIFTALKKVESDSEVTTDEKTGGLSVIFRSKTKRFVLNDLEKDSLFNQEIFYKQKPITKEKTTVIPWKLQDSTKTIGEFKCQLAIGEFRGRTYHAWFTQDIPVRFGPWKLQGLPGLILEANDEQYKVSYRAKKVSISPMIIDSINTDEAIELQSFIKAKPQYLKEIEKNMGSKLPRNGTVEMNLPNRNTQQEISYEWEVEVIENH
ncbi:GLPGLI family protein [Olleya sp. HaHaR_3_96]|uniref:GLPGLI family protein n=1 Tax=Olleya sp. HaHaR_3_96 TaxID=2745560 RepID=UPI001C4F2B86|nr:GLPGLI family protein [Olleya sp. HaHaR_3_96]QXP60681.1 GLPGLI family protein [Olleya sp. HaHaR_3_96]